LDTRDSFSSIRERFTENGQTDVWAIIPPEETTTFNLVRRLSAWWNGSSNDFVVALHSKGLEGGTKNMPASGADLEMAVEVAPNVWVDLLLQAKRIYPDSTYKEWKQSQIDKLRHWAFLNNRTPGILLYNAEIPPFGGPQTRVELGACCHPLVRCWGRDWPQSPKGGPWSAPNEKSPLAITLAILPDYSQPLSSDLHGDRLPTAVVNKYASPLECIFCPSRVARPARATDKKLSENRSPIPVKNHIPGWAAELRGETSQGILAEPEERTSNYSLVLPFIGGGTNDEEDG
jgi:hypothetical protein